MLLVQNKRRQPTEGLPNNNESLLLIGPSVASETQANPPGSCNHQRFLGCPLSMGIKLKTHNSVRQLLELKKNKTNK